MQWHVLQAYQDTHFHLHLTTYDNLSMFDAYYKTLSSRVGENGLQQQTDLLQLLYEANHYIHYFASPWPSVQYWSIQIFYDPSL